MSFDFRTRVNQLAEQKAEQLQQDIQKRDRDNAVARELVQGIMVQYAGRLGNQFASVQGNVATLTKQNGGALTIMVLGENQFIVKEKGGTGGLREPKLHDNLQKDQLDKNGMMDTVIEWFAEG